MPRFDAPTMDTHAMPGSAYGFSAARPIDLGASEYTLVAIAADCSSSVSGFAQEIEDCVVEVVGSCAHSPRADNLMLRLTTFADSVKEVHGYRPLSACPRTDYQGTIRAGGCTALCDAALTAVQSLATYGAQLEGHDFDVNGIVFVITDGADNSSTSTAADIQRALTRARAQAHLSSLLTVLVGVGVDHQGLSRELTAFERAAGFDRYIELKRADATTLAKLAEFVSKSISLQSQSLATGRAQGLGF